MIEQQITPTFDYSQLEPDMLDALVDQENMLEDVLVRSRKEIGQILIAVKKLLPYGTFESWYQSKGIRKHYAYNCMQDAQGKLNSKSSRRELLELPLPQKQPTIDEIVENYDLDALDASVEEGTDIDVAAMV